jgi:DNA-binding transcriptional LysR family regulator
MNIESLKSFFLIAKEGNISNVTNAVHLTQSALSQQIQRLESELSKTLLIRSNKGVELTTNGKIVFKYAEHILRIHEKMMMELAAEEKASANIKIQACSSAADYVLPCTLITANKTFPNHNYELTSNPSNEIITNVSNEICDIGFSCVAYEETSRPEMVIEKVGAIKIVLISKKDSSFPDEASLERLMGSNLITYTERNNITSTLVKNLTALGYTKNCLNCNLRVEGIESAKKLVVKNFGVAFVPYISVKEELYKKQLKIISVPEINMDLDIIMIYKKDCSGHVKDFVLWFKKYGAKSFC